MIKKTKKKKMMIIENYNTWYTAVVKISEWTKSFDATLTLF